MKLGVRGKLFLFSLVVVTAVVVGSGFFLQRFLREWSEESIQQELFRHAAAARTLIESVPDASSIGAVDAYADRLGAATDTRITIIADDGRVLGDSELDPGEVRDIENHADRPEVVDAFSTDEGMSRRFSDTLTMDMLYVAVRFERADGGGVVRASRSLRSVIETIHRLQALIAAVSLLGIVMAAVLSAAVSHYLSRTIRDLVDVARSIAQGGDRRRAPVRSTDEIGGLAGTLNKLAEELEQTVATLARERDRFEALLQGMSEGVLAINAAQEVMLVNRAARGMLEIAPRPQGRPVSVVLPIPELRALLDKTLKGEPSSTEFTVKLPGGDRVLMARGTPLRTTGGSVVVFHDMTEIRRLERIRRDFVANVSHELRTPISIIMANAETLLSGALDDRQRAEMFLGAMLRNAERLSNLIADLLDISRIEDGRYRLDMTFAPVHDMALKAIEGVAAAARDKQHTIEVRIDPELKAAADEQALDHVLMNLLDNAVKYTPAGGTIVVDAHDTGDEVRVEVRDNGPGIPPEHRQRLFERFYRVDPGRSREMGGTGLGLSIVKHLVLAHGGSVGMEPGEPAGSVFWFTLKKRMPNASAQMTFEHLAIKLN